MPEGTRRTPNTRPARAWDRRCVMCADCRVLGDLRPVETLRVKEERL